MPGCLSACLCIPAGTGVLNTIMDSYQPMAGEILMRDNGSLTATETGAVSCTLTHSHTHTHTMCLRSICMRMHAHTQPCDTKGYQCRAYQSNLLLADLATNLLVLTHPSTRPVLSNSHPCEPQTFFRPRPNLTHLCTYLSCSFQSARRLFSVHYIPQTC